MIPLDSSQTSDPDPVNIQFRGEPLEHEISPCESSSQGRGDAEASPSEKPVTESYGEDLMIEPHEEPPCAKEISGEASGEVAQEAPELSDYLSNFQPHQTGESIASEFNAPVESRDRSPDEHSAETREVDDPPITAETGEDLAIERGPADSRESAENLVAKRASVRESAKNHAVERASVRESAKDHAVERASVRESAKDHAVERASVRESAEDQIRLSEQANALPAVLSPSRRSDIPIQDDAVKSQGSGECLFIEFSPPKKAPKARGERKPRGEPPGPESALAPFLPPKAAEHLPEVSPRRGEKVDESSSPDQDANRRSSRFGIFESCFRPSQSKPQSPVVNRITEPEAPPGTPSQSTNNAPPPHPPQSPSDGLRPVNISDRTEPASPKDPLPSKRGEVLEIEFEMPRKKAPGRKRFGRAPFSKAGESAEKPSTLENEEPIMTSSTPIVSDASVNGTPLGPQIGDPVPSSGKPGEEEKKAASSTPKSNDPLPAPSVRVVSETAVNETVLNPLGFEEASAEFLNFFPQSVLDELASKQWKDRLSGLTSIHARLDEGNVTALCHSTLYVLHKTPGWKEVNVQVASSLFEAVTKLALTSDAFSNKLAALPLVSILNKLGDPKVAPAAKDCAVALCEALGAETVVPMIISRVGTVKNPKALQGIAKTVHSIVEDFSASCAPVKPVIELGKSFLGHGTVGVRNDATALLIEVYRQAGSPAMLNLIIDGLKPALAKTIEAELAQITPGAPVMPSRFKRGQKPTGPASAAKNLVLVDRVDINAKVTSKLLKQMEDDAWKERKEALDTVSRILDEARHSIQPNIKTLVKAVLARITDANKLLVLTALTVLRTLAEDIGPDNVHKHAKAVVPVVLTQVADSKKHIAAEARATLLCWLSESALGIGFPFVSKSIEQTALLRDGLLETLLQRLSPEDLDLPTAEELLSPVFICLQDKVPGVRQKSEKLLAMIVPKVGLANVRNDVTSLSRTAQITINAVLDKLNLPGDPYVTPAAPAPVSNKAPDVVASAKPAERVLVRPKSASAKPSSQTAVDDGQAPHRKGLSRTLRKSKPEAKRVLKRSKSVEPVVAAGPAQQAGGEHSDIFLCDNRTVASRKESRWRQGPIGFQEWIPSDVAHLKELLAPNVSAQLLNSMFSDDFQKQIVAIDLIQSAIAQSEESVSSLRDLLLMWVSLRIAEDKTQVVVKILNLCMSILSSGIVLDEYDANCLIPVIVEKLLAHNKQPLRVRGRELLRKASPSWGSSVIGKFLLDGIIMSKSVRAKSACIEELLFLADDNPFDVAVPKKTLQAIAEFVTSHDASLRKASIALIEKACQSLGESTFWSRISPDLPDRNRVAIDKIIKKVCQSQNLPPLQNQPPSPRFGHISRPRTRIPESISTSLNSTASSAESEQAISLMKSSISSVTIPKAAPVPTSTMLAELDRDIFKLDLDELAVSGESVSNSNKDAANAAPRNDFLPIALEGVIPGAVGKDTDIAASLDMIILQLESIDEEARIDAMRMLSQLSEHCGPDDQTLIRRANTIVGLLLCHFREAFEMDPQQVNVTKPVVHTLMELFKSSSFALELNVQTLTSFYQSLLPVLGTGNVRTSSEQKSIRSFINILVTKSLEITDRTRCYCALIRGMNDFWSFGYDKKDKSVSTLYCRCLAKLARGLHLCHKRLEIGPLLEEIDQFLERHPESFWSSFAPELGQNMPWNLVYTLVVTIIKLRGNSFLSELPACALVPNSVLRRIIHEKLSNLENERCPPLDSTLSDIFRRIKDSNCPDAMRELSHFQAANPCVDLEPYFADMPDHVRQTVMRRMSLIETPTANVPTSSDSAPSSSTLESFQARLKNLQSRASSQDPPVQRTVPVTSSLELPSSSISRIRERLQISLQNSASEPKDSQTPVGSVSGAIHADNHISESESQSKPAVASLDAIRARIAKLRAASTASLLP